MARQLYEYHPIIGYRFIPELKARVPHESGGYFVQVNNLGFRCRHQMVSEKPPGTLRVLLFGDSFTAGDGVSNEYRYGDLLEERIPNLQVYNFGLPGTGTDQHYLAYREYGQTMEHDVLVIGALVENIRRVVAHYRYYQNDRGERLVYAKPYFELQEAGLVLKNIPVPRDSVAESSLTVEERKTVDRGGRFEVLRQMVNRVGLKGAVQRLVRYQPLPEYSDPEGPAWRLMRELLAQWICSHRKPAIVMPIPLYQYVEETSDPSGYQARFRELEEAVGCVIHDPLPDLLRYPAEQRRRFRFERDIHLTPAGHAALADSLAPVLTKVLRLPLGSRDTQ